MKQKSCFKFLPWPGFETRTSHSNARTSPLGYGAPPKHARRVQLWFKIQVRTEDTANSIMPICFVKLPIGVFDLINALLSYNMLQHITVHLQLKFIRKKKAVMKRWDREKLKTKSKELSDKIEEHLEERELMSTEERWNRLKKVVKEAAVETIGYQMGSAPPKPWVTTGMIQEMEERRKWKHQRTDEAKSEYRRLNNKLRKTTDKAREKWWEEQCEDLEELQAKGRHDTVYAKIRTLTRKPDGNRDIAIKDRSGKLLQDPVEVRKRWKEYIEELYKGVDNSHDYKEEEPQTTDKCTKIRR